MISAAVFMALLQLPPRVQQPRQQTDAAPPVVEAAPAGAHAAAPQQQTQQADTARSEASTIVTQGGTVVKRHMQPTDDQWNIFAKYQTKLHEDAKKVEQAARRHKEKSLRDRLDAQLQEKHALKVQEKRMNWEKEQRILKNDRAAKQALLDQEQARRLKDIENFEYAKQAAVEAEEAKRQAREREREEGRQRADLTLTQP